MPLNTEILRGGEQVQVRWGNFHVACLALASSFDAGTDTSIGHPSRVYEGPPSQMWDCYPDAPFPVTRDLAFWLTSYSALSKTPLNNGAYQLTRRHKFMDTTDGEVLHLLPGDVLRAVRSSF